MPEASFEVTVVSSGHVSDLPGRGGDEDIVAIARSLGGPSDPAEAGAFLLAGLTSTEPDTFTEDFLAELLLRPPIPAGCVALIQRIADGDDPWLDHEVVEDRAGLFTAHAIVHRIAPESYPAPSLPQMVLRVRPAPAPRAWRRPRPRTLWVGAALAAAPDAPGLLAGPVPEWAFDTLWHTGAEPVSDTDALLLDVRGPLPWVGTIEPGISWNFEQS